MLMEYSSAPPPRYGVSSSSRGRGTTPPPSTAPASSTGNGTNNNIASARERLRVINRIQQQHQDLNKVKRYNKSNSYDGTDATDQDYYCDENGRCGPTSNPSTIVPLLTLQVYHLPGNGYWQDWWQFLANNHPIFGICCRHKLHPIKTKTRLVALVGTVVFGLIITNVFYFLYLWQDNLDQTVATFFVPTAEDPSYEDDGEQSSSIQQQSAAANADSGFTLTTGMLLLWTVGGGIHAAYNLLIWHIAACACCRPGGCCSGSRACCPNLGKHVVRIFVMLVVVFAAILVLMRVGIAQQRADLQDEWYDNNGNLDYDNNNATSSFMDNDGYDAASDAAANAVNAIINSPGSGSSSAVKDGSSLVSHDVHQVDFVWSYMIEMILSLFIYYPIGATILFSGVLGCGSLPLLGGRPREVMLEKKQLQERAEQRRLEHIQMQQRRHQEEIQRRKQRIRAQEMRREIFQLRSLPTRNYDDTCSPTSGTNTATTTSLFDQVEFVDDLGSSFDDCDIELAWSPREEQEFYQRRQQELQELQQQAQGRRRERRPSYP